MNKLKGRILIIIVAMLLGGCITYPTKHTYFQPSALDGKLHDSTPCSHWTSENDSITLEIEGIKIDATAYYSKKRNLSIVLVIEPQDKKVNIRAELYEITDSQTEIKYVPLKSTVNSRTDRVATSFLKSEEVFRYWITLEYDLLADQIDEFALLFPDNSLTLDGNNINLSPIDFKKVEKNTLGYGSINC